jgi:hypothetical protein
MKSLYEKCKTVVVAVGSVACLIVMTNGPVDAQGINPRASGAMRRAERMQRQNENYERDKLERELETGPERPSSRRNEADVARVKQDFERLQSTYNRIVLAMASRQGLQREALLEEVAEIKKTAVRLKVKLALPGSEEVEPNAAQTVQLGFPDSLLKLRKHIYDFLTNPLFDSPGAYEVDEAKRASGDLEKIIEVSETIGKHAETK